MPNVHLRRIGPDLEHGLFALYELPRELELLRPPGSTRPTLAPIVRIQYEGGQDYRHFVKQVLDAGMFGIILPHVNTAEEARRLVETMRYPPQRNGQFAGAPYGVRGSGAGAAVAYWGVTTEEYYRKADLWPLNPEGELLAIVMIETETAVENIEEILSVPGISAAVVGPGDLAFSMGVALPPSDSMHPEVQAAIARVAEACVRLNAWCGFTGVPDDIDFRLEQGFNFFTGGGHVSPR